MMFDYDEYESILDRAHIYANRCGGTVVKEKDRSITTTVSVMNKNGQWLIAWTLGAGEWRELKTLAFESHFPEESRGYRLESGGWFR